MHGNEKIEVYIGKTINMDETKSIAQEVFENKNIKIQTVEVFEDMLAITVQSTTDEQIEKLVQLLNEKYELKYTKDDVNIIKIPATNINSVVNNYKIPFLAIIIISAIYMSIRYWKLGVCKMFFATICICILALALFASIYLIIRIPVGEVDMPVCMLLLGMTIFIMGLYYNKKVE